MPVNSIQIDLIFFISVAKFQSTNKMEIKKKNDLSKSELPSFNNWRIHDVYLSSNADLNCE